MLCKIEGCTNRRSKVTYKKYRSVCLHHWYEQIGRLADYNTNHAGKMKELSSTPCYKCGWDYSYTDRHRVAPGRKGGQYTLENTKSICPNCHRIATYAELITSENEQDRRRVGSNYELCSVEGCINRATSAGYGRLRKRCSLHRKPELYNKQDRISPLYGKKEFRKEIRNLIVMAETKGLTEVKGKLKRLLLKYDRDDSHEVCHT